MEMIITDGADLRAERERRGLTQARLAELAGISHASRLIYKIEKGAVVPKISTALKLSRALLAEQGDGAAASRASIIERAFEEDVEAWDL